ncbi:hypothetical protein JZ751_003108 [Albula glossodonta]|uniref:Nucleolar and spindle-associated protein 1 n=1 Tax=Albula glossodonta TaxID=121402 RepID=A0A8T2NBQ7_9TELE|nr:hypothetical protein JZ751_003108 [Albula glossodonta]
MDLDSLKYAELQRLAKDVGLKANMKAEKLLKALKEHYQQLSSKENVDSGVNEEREDINATQHSPNHNTAFVTERRGRAQKAKRKQSGEEDDEAKFNGNTAQSSSQTDEEFEKPAEGQQSSKRRRLSAADDSGAAPTEGKSEELLPSATNGKAGKPARGGGQKSVQLAGKIPRHEGLLKRTSKPVLKPTTPNFKKLHEAHFKKMESIDSYVQRKTKQMEVFRNSVKELKLLSEKACIKPVDSGKPVMKSNPNRASLFSPMAQERRSISDKRRLTQMSASKSALKNSDTFKPTVLSTRRMNVSFSKTTQDNEHKRSLVKTPARMSPHVEMVTTPGAESEQVKPEAKKSVVSSTKTAGGTPFIFSGNTSISNTPGTNKKNAFDLKASLSRPLTYQPHKGKLKPFGMAQENSALNTTQSHQNNYKQHKVQTRDERRTKLTEGRKQKKEHMLGARRGLVMT